MYYGTNMHIHSILRRTNKNIDKIYLIKSKYIH